MYLELAKKILDKEYKEKKAIAGCDGLILIEEKIVHSYQVLGAGNLILKNEDCYQNSNIEEVDLLKSTLLLHDLGRFEESIRVGIDHGVYGAELLKNIAEFSKTSVLLAIKHHGHLIEDLWEDEEYKALSDEEKKEVKKYIFLVRDADKIANFYLLSRKFDEMEDLFFYPKRKIASKEVGTKIFDDFSSFRAINKKEVKTVAEQALMVLACVFDLNYKASFKFLDKTEAVKKLFMNCCKYWEESDADVFSNKLFSYMEKRLGK